MTDLEDFLKKAEKTSIFIKVESGVPFEGVFKEAKLIDDPFNSGEKTMQYTIEIDGQDKTFKSKSVKLARQLRDKKEGAILRIVRMGSGTATSWTVEEL